MTTPPNILFFFTDDQRFDTIRALGNSEIHTPNLDRLVARGTTFTRAHIPGGTVPAVCMPSRAMLHTGRTLFHIKGCGEEISEDHTLMGEAFRQAGYETFGTGKWHNGKRAYARSFSAGAEIFFDGMGDHWNVPAFDFDPSGEYKGTCPYIAEPFRSNKLAFRNYTRITTGKHSTDLFADATIRFIAQHHGQRPFFIYTSLMAPHDPRTMPEKFRNLYDPKKITLPENFLEQHPIDTGALQIRDEMLAAFPRDPAEIRRHIAEYYAMITHLDDAFGRIVEALRARGVLENTIIVVAGDNGLAVGQHGLMGKQSAYDHSMRVPLIFAGPGVPQGARSDALVYLLDIFPTLCDLSGVTIPASVEGLSMTPLMGVGSRGRSPSREAAPNRACSLEGERPREPQRREQLYLAYADSIRGVTDGNWKLVEYACGATQLFDLKNDPLEMHDLHEQETAATKIAELRAHLLRIADNWNDREHDVGARFWAARKDLKA